MSLINDMLRDLDRRRASMGKTSSLAPVPPSRQAPSRRGILIVLATAIIGGGLLLFAAYWLGRNTISQPAPPHSVYQGKTRAVTPATQITPVPIVHQPNQARIPQQPALLAVVPSPQGAAIPGLWLTFSAPITLPPLPGDSRTLRIRLTARLAGRLPTPPVMRGIASLKFARTHAGILLLARATTGFRLHLVSVPKAEPAHSILVLQARPITSAPLQTSHRQAGRMVRVESPSRVHTSKAKLLPSTTASIQRRITQQAQLSPTHLPSTPVGASTGGSVTVHPQPVSPTVRAHQAYNRAMQDLAAGHVSSGNTALHRALEIDPQLIPARLLLAGLEAKAGRLQPALSLLDAGLALHPDNSRRLSLVRLKARMLIDAGYINRALEVLKKNAPPVSMAPDYHALLAGLEVRAGDYRQAAQQYAALLTLNPDRAVWWLGLGIALDQSGQVQAALKAYQNALQHLGLSSASETYAHRRIKALEGGKQ